MEIRIPEEGAVKGKMMIEPYASYSSWKRSLSHACPVMEELLQQIKNLNRR